MEKLTGVLQGGHKSSMSLSCKVEMEIEEGIIKHVRLKGMPRPNIDNWHYTIDSYKEKIKNKEVEITKEEIDNFISINTKGDNSFSFIKG